MDKRNDKLEFLLDKILEKDSIVTANVFYKSDFYISDRGNNDRMELEFKELIKEFERIGVGDIIDNGNGIRQNLNSRPFNDEGGFVNHYAKEKENEIKQKERQVLKDKIDRLTETNLILQNKELRNKVWYGIIGFTVGAILTNAKEILILLQILPQE